MATSQLHSEYKHDAPLCDEYWMNKEQCVFFPDGLKNVTKLGLLWRSCSHEHFLQLRGRIPPGLEYSCKYFHCIDYPATVIACLPDEMKQLSAEDVDLLRPVPAAYRLSLVGRHLRIGITCGVGDCVLAVDPAVRHATELTKYIVKYKGSLRERNRDRRFQGTYFGLVSAEPVKYPAAKELSCFGDTLSPDVVQYVTRGSSEYHHQAVLCTLQWIVALVDKQFSLKAGDRVLQFVDEQPLPLKGVVIRVLSDRVASVEFDFNGQKQRKEAAIESLMHASDYEDESAKACAAAAAPTSAASASNASDAVPVADAVASSTNRATATDRNHAAMTQPNQQSQADPVALAAEHGLELNAAVLVDEGKSPPLPGFLRWCGRHRDRAIAGVDCDMPPLDSLNAASVRRACPDAPADSSVAFVLLDRVRLDPRLRTNTPALKSNSRPVFQSENSQSSLANLLEPNFTSWNIVRGPDAKKKLLGEGGFGKVYKAFTDCHQTIAVKIVKLIGIRDADLLEKVIQQESRGIEMLRNVQHENILVFLKSERTSDNRFCIFTELIAGSTLAEIMGSQKKAFDEAGVRKFSRQICSALNFLHLRSPAILHRDINCNNIMLTHEGIIKLIDFGLAKEIITTTVVHDTKNVCGTWYFMAPELFNPDGNALFTPKSDVWAFGCSVFEMVDMQPPNRHLRQEQIPMALLTRDMPQMKPEVSEDLRDFYRRCVVKDPKMRADTTELMGHRFLH